MNTIKPKKPVRLRVRLFVHPDIQKAFPDDVLWERSGAAIARYVMAHGKRTDKEIAICFEVQSKDLWFLVKRKAADKWEVVIHPEKEAQEYMKNWEKDWEDDIPPYFSASLPDSQR